MEQTQKFWLTVGNMEYINALQSLEPEFCNTHNAGSVSARLLLLATIAKRIEDRGAALEPMPRTPIWIDQNDVAYFEMSEIDDLHLRNIIRWLENNALPGVNRIDPFRDEADRRGLVL